MTARDIIRVVFIHHYDGEYAKSKKLAAGDFFLAQTGWRSRNHFALLSEPPTALQMRQDHYNAVCIIADRDRTDKLLRGIEWVRHSTPTSGGQLHLRGCDIYAAVGAAILARECAEW